MIDPETEKLISLSDEAKLVPSVRSGKCTHVATLIRWILKGTRAPNGEKVRLEANRLPGGWVTSAEAIRRFMERLTPAVDQELRIIPRSPTRRERDNSRAKELLAAAGF